MCKNASFLKVIRTSSIHEEYTFDTSKNDLVADGLEDSENNNIMYYYALRGVEAFYDTYKRYPGEVDEEVEDDVSLLKTCVTNLMQDSGVMAGPLNVKAEIVQEMCRFGNSEPHSMAAFMGGVGSQEVIKILTHQYIPVNNTYIFNGISSSSAIYKL